MSKKSAPLLNGPKVYPLSRSQATVHMQTMCLHKGMLQLPCVLYFERAIDPDLFRKAVDLEVERNDSMRMRFFMKKENGKKTCFQYFTDPFPFGDIPFFDYSGKSRDEVQELLTPMARKPMDYYNAVSAKFAVFHYGEGKSGVLTVVNHLAMDSYGEFVLLTDLFNVYAALETGSELPKAPASAEEVLIKELTYSEEQADKDVAALQEYYAKTGVRNGDSPVVNLDIDIPKKYRKRATAKPNMLRDAAAFFLRDASECYKAAISAEKMAEVYAYCEREQMGFTNLFVMLVRNYLARITHSDQVLYYCLVNRRGTLKEKQSGGCRVGAFYDASNLPGEMTFREAVKVTSAAYSFGYRHAALGAAEIGTKVMTPYGVNALAPGGNLMLTILPTYSGLPEGFDADMQWISVGHTMNQLYLFTTPGPGGSLCLNYEYRTYLTCRSQMEYMHQSILKMLDMVLEDPDIPIQQLIDAV